MFWNVFWSEFHQNWREKLFFVQNLRGVTLEIFRNINLTQKQYPSITENQFVWLSIPNHPWPVGGTPGGGVWGDEALHGNWQYRGRSPPNTKKFERFLTNFFVQNNWTLEVFRKNCKKVRVGPMGASASSVGVPVEPTFLRPPASSSSSLWASSFWQTRQLRAIIINSNNEIELCPSPKTGKTAIIK